LVFIKYDDKDEGKRAYVFFYPSRDQTWLFEGDDSTQKQVDDLNIFEESIC